jgi:hypothetical protein
MEESVCVHATLYPYVLQPSCKDVLSVWATEPGESQLAFHGGASESGSSVEIHVGLYFVRCFAQEKLQEN